MTDSLTDRQQEVARLVAQGYTNKQIGACLSIQAVTVRVHISAIVRVWQLDQSLDARVQIADRMKAAELNVLLVDGKQHICDTGVRAYNP